MLSYIAFGKRGIGYREVDVKFDLYLCHTVRALKTCKTQLP